MLEVERLSISFEGADAVRDASLVIERGDRIGLVGESGSGKSVFGLSLMGMAPEATRVQGSIRLAGREMTGVGDGEWRRHRGRDVAMVFQEPMSALNPLRSIGQTIMEPLMVLERLPYRAAWKRALDLLAEVDIPDPLARMRQYPHEISGGQRQRVLIALALARDPALLIADEPTTALDAHVAKRVIDLMVELSARRRMALLFISHDLGAVGRATEKLIVMYGGDMVERGTTAEILENPQHPYTKGLLAARPKIDPWLPRRTRLQTIAGTVPQLSELAPGCRFSGRCPVEMSRCAAERPPVWQAASGRSAFCHLLGDAPATAEKAARQAAATVPSP